MPEVGFRFLLKDRRRAAGSADFQTQGIAANCSLNLL
jgi:hypothetical protein